MFDLNTGIFEYLNVGICYSQIFTASKIRIFESPELGIFASMHIPIFMMMGEAASGSADACDKRKYCRYIVEYAYSYIQIF